MSEWHRAQEVVHDTRTGQLRSMKIYDDPSGIGNYRSILFSSEGQGSNPITIQVEYSGKKSASFGISLRHEDVALLAQALIDRLPDDLEIE